MCPFFLLPLWPTTLRPMSNPQKVLSVLGQVLWKLGPFVLLLHTHLHGVMDPVQELRYLGIDTWVIGLCTATTPADHPYKVPHITTGTHKGSPAVPLRNPNEQTQRNNTQTHLVEQHQSTTGNGLSW